MGFGPVALSSISTSDEVAPGMPSFVEVTQLSNTDIQCVVTIPTTDSDGSELSGLTKLVVATATMTEGVNPFELLTMDEILALPGVTMNEETLDPEVDPGQQKTVILPVVNLGGFQALAAACSDE